jgi:uncharacterized integral membrane protein (TIGR00697 family)
MIQLSEKSFRKLIIALTIYLTSLFAANTLGLKIMPFLFGTHVTVAVFMLPFVFLMTDVIGETYGRKVAKFFVRAGLISTIIFIAFTYLSLYMPWSEAGAWIKDSYGQVFGISGRIAIASVVAFGLAEFQDVFVFFLVKKKIGSRFFWLRSLLSNIWSQLLDTIVFMIIAFYGVYDNHTLIGIMFTLWIYKVLMGLLYTPLSYVGLRLLKDSPTNE